MRGDIQSRNEMYPLSVMFGNETKENLEHMGVTYNKSTVFETDATAINLVLMPLEVNHKCDMSLQWKIVKRGCTARKGNDFFGMCCNCLGKHMTTPQENCDTCEVRNDPAPSPYVIDSSCFHHLFDIDCIEMYKEKAKEIVELLQSDLGEFEDAESHFDRHEPAQAGDGVPDPYTISFESRTVAESMALSDNIKDDLMERKSIQLATWRSCV
jgi:hypothetical protein